jgi:hypothetical protein
MDAANLLARPRGELHAISHHAKEYQKYIGRRTRPWNAVSRP